MTTFPVVLLYQESDRSTWMVALLSLSVSFVEAALILTTAGVTSVVLTFSVTRETSGMYPDGSDEKYGKAVLCSVMAF